MKGAPESAASHFPSLLPDGLMILVPSLNAFVSHGDFLLALMSPEATNPTVCRVLGALLPDRLVVTWWMNHTEASSRGIMQFPPPIAIDKYVNVHKCRLTEVSEICSSSSTIHVNDVKDIAFVFHVDTLEVDLPNCAGMCRVFYTRYFYDDENGLKLVDCRNHAPFSNILPDSFPSRIWHSILDVKEKVEKCLNDPKQYQPCKKMVLFKFSLESWNYIVMNLTNSGAVIESVRRNYTRKYMECDLTMSSRRIKQYFTLLRLDSSRSICSARALFGLTFGIGVRNRAPNKGDPSVSLHHADIVNVADVASNLYDNIAIIGPDRRREFTYDQGIDFIFEQVTRTLKIRVRYSKVDAQREIVASTLRLNASHLGNRNHVDNHPEHDLNGAVNNISLWAQHIAPGKCFELNGEMAEVNRVDDNIVFVLVDGNDVEQQINLNEAAELLRAYIG